MTSSGYPTTHCRHWDLNLALQVPRQHFFFSFFPLPDSILQAQQRTPGSLNKCFYVHAVPSLKCIFLTLAIWIVFLSLIYKTQLQWDFCILSPSQYPFRMLTHCMLTISVSSRNCELLESSICTYLYIPGVLTR